MRRALPLIATLAALPLAAVAQETPPVIGQLVLTDTEVQTKANPAHGQVIIGTLPDGTRVEVELEGDGTLDEIDAVGRGLFSASLIAAALPQAILGSADWPADALLESADFDRSGAVEIEGVGADGRAFEAEFAADGRLVEMEQDD